ncbi:PREDICTED: RING-H2 finger protein ATL40-like [Ipomoea nil]|uniref:RING-H2 finger protein ATL40-like n=1 Tax=Ipomoea nil TaxID=35883 RepID=UPI000900B9A7|nr:PREDICTED: RING-H2 finger protein ATL40-like [Ipomoea nil]
MRTASLHAIFFLVLLIIFTYTFKKLLRMFPQSTILNYVVFLLTQLKWSWDHLLRQSFCQFPGAVTGASPEVGGVRVFEGGGAKEAVECAVCLCGIEEGEEIRDLRCAHIFHRACLDRWLGTGRMTCPLCRCHVKVAAAAAGGGGGWVLNDLHEEAIVFDFFSDHRDRCTWWLR